MERCPMCFGGITVNPSSHRIGRGCSTCGGVGYINPDMICFCGRHAPYSQEGFSFCGRKECLAGLKAAAITAEIQAKWDTEDRHSDGWYGHDMFPGIH